MSTILKTLSWQNLKASLSVHIKKMFSPNLLLKDSTSIISGGTTLRNNGTVVKPQMLASIAFFNYDLKVSTFF